MRALALALAASLAACKATSPTDPQTWLPLLQDSDPRVRVKAVQALRKLKARQAGRGIARLLKDPLVKEEAALALQHLGGPGEVQPLLDALATTSRAGSDTAPRVTTPTHATIAPAPSPLRDLP